jgi:hypothetical protein
MAEYYQRYIDQVTSYDNYQVFLAQQQIEPVNVRMMNLYFNKDLYLDTQPNIPPIQTINMENKNKNVLYNTTELADINNIFNFFGGINYSIGRAWRDLCIYYNTRFNEGLIDTINDIKTEYSIP